MTMPGTLTKLMPEIDAPIMPNATSCHGDLRLPPKNALFPELLLTARLTAHNIAKYVTRINIAILRL